MPRTKDYEGYGKKVCRRINESRKWRTENFDKDWKRAIDLYGMKHFEDDTIFEDMTAVNMMFSTVNVIYPSVSVNHPKIAVNPTTPEDADAATTVEAVINYWWRHHHLHTQVRRAIKDFVVLGHGWVKVTYLYEEADAPRDPAEMLQEAEGLLQQKQQALVTQQDDADLFPSDEEIMSQVSTTETIVTEDRPIVERVSPFDMFIDPDCTDLSNARWIAQRIVIPLEEAKKNDAWNKGARADLQGSPLTGASQDENLGFAKEREDKEAMFVTVYEYYDLMKAEMCVVATEGTEDKVLLDPQAFPYSFGHPFCHISNYDVPERFYALGDIECLAPLQDELNIARSAMVAENKKHRNKYLGNKDALDADALAALKSQNEDEVVLVEIDKLAGGSLATHAVVPLPVQPIAQDLYHMSEVISDDINNVSGVSEYARGALPEGRRTATEANMIQDASNARSADKLATVEQFISYVASRCVQLAQQYLSTEQVARIAGVGAAFDWVPFDADTIKGEFDFEVEAGSTQPMNETFRRQQAMQLFEMLSPMAVPGGPVNVFELLKHVMEQGFGIKDVDKFLVMPPPMIDPMTGMPMDPLMAQQQQMMGGEQNGIPSAPTGGSEVPPPEGGGYA